MHSVDIHVGRQLRRRRRILGLTQKQLAEAIGVRFQQIQKYECGANRVTAGRLYDPSCALDVSVQYFYEAIPPQFVERRQGHIGADLQHASQNLSDREAQELVHAYARLGQQKRQTVLDMARAIDKSGSDAA